MNHKPTCWNKGIPRTPEEKKNISKGISKESRKRSSKRMKDRWKAGEFNNSINGPSQSVEARLKISKASTGRHLSMEARELIRKSRLGKPGNVMSDKAKKSQSKRMKLNNPMFRKEVLENHPVLQSGPNFISIGENKLIQIFTERDFDFIHQKQIAKERGFYTVDFFFPNQNKIIEFDGHESHRMFPEKDKIRDLFVLNTYGFETLRLLPIDLNNSNRKELLTKINTFLGYEIKTNQNKKQNVVCKRTIHSVRFNRTR